MVYAVDGSYNNDVTSSVYGIHRPSIFHFIRFHCTQLLVIFGSPVSDARTKASGGGTGSMYTTGTQFLITLSFVGDPATDINH